MSGYDPELHRKMQARPIREEVTTMIEGDYYGRGLWHNVNIRITRESDDEDGAVYRVEATRGGEVGSTRTGTWYLDAEAIRPFIEMMGWGKGV